MVLIDDIEIWDGYQEEEPAVLEVALLVMRETKLDEKIGKEHNAYPELECHVVVVAQERQVLEGVVADIHYQS